MTRKTQKSFKEFTNEEKKKITGEKKYYATLTIKTKKGDETFHLNKPTKKAIGEAFSLAKPISGSPDLIGAGEILLNDAWAEGFKPTKEMDIAACAMACYELIDIKESILTHIDDLEDKTGLPENTEYVLEVEGKKCYLTELKRKTLSEALNYIYSPTGKPNYILAGECILLSCFISGEREFHTDDSFRLAAALGCYGLVELSETDLKKN